MNVVNYFSIGWVVLRGGGWCVLGFGKGVFFNLIYVFVNKEGDFV